MLDIFDLLDLLDLLNTYWTLIGPISRVGLIRLTGLIRHLLDTC